MFIRLALILAFLYASVCSLCADEGEDGGANVPPCEEGGPYYGDWYCNSAGAYDGNLEVSNTSIVIPVGDSPSDPVTGESTFSDSEKERTVDYDCPEPYTDTETGTESHGGSYEIRIASGSAEGTPDFNGGSFDEPGTFSYDVFAVTTDSEESSNLCSPSDENVGSFTVTVVGVASVEGEGESSTTSSPGEDETIYVALAENGEGAPATITLTATSEPSGSEGESSWPADEPTWSGDDEGEGEGEGGSETYDFPIDTISADKDGTTMTASCGTTSKAIKVVVVGVASVQGEGVEFTDENGTVVSTSDADEPEADEIIFVTENDIESTITLTAISDPSDSVGEGEVESLWPDEEPTWEGATASEGDPAIATVPASEVLEDGFIEVEVACGASVKKIWLLKVEVSSEKATNPNGTHTPKQTLEFAIPSPGNIAAGEEQDALDNALVIYYKDVVSGTSIEVDPFDVKFKTPGLSTTAWFETGNNNSSSTRGDLQNPISEEATLSIAAQGGDISGPVDGGLYKYSASLSDDLSFPVQVWLPVAGPSIDAAFMAQIAGFSSWGIDYRDQLNTVRVPAIKSESPFTWGLLPNSEVARAVRLDDMRQLGNILDWYGAPSGQYTPSGGPKNNTPLGVQEHRTTVGGVVVDWPKRNNILYAVVGRNMGISTTLLEVGPNLVGGDNNTPDDQYAIASYNIGFRLFNEEGLNEVMADIGREMHVPGGWAEKEWPSFEVESSETAIQLRQIADLVMNLLLDEDGFHESGN